MRWNFYLTGGILILLGALTFRYPVEAIMTAGFFIGLGLVASSLNYFTGWYFVRFRRFLALGLLDFIAGVIMLAQPGLSAFFMPFIIGAWLFSTGITRTCAAFWLGGAKIRGWWVVLLNGLALIISALLICASPFVASISIMILLGCILIIAGVFSVVEGITLY